MPRSWAGSTACPRSPRSGWPPWPSATATTSRWTAPAAPSPCTARADLRNGRGAPMRYVHWLDELPPGDAVVLAGAKIGRLVEMTTAGIQVPVPRGFVVGVARTAPLPGWTGSSATRWPHCPSAGQRPAGRRLDPDPRRVRDATPGCSTRTNFAPSRTRSVRSRSTTGMRSTWNGCSAATAGGDPIEYWLTQPLPHFERLSPWYAASGPASRPAPPSVAGTGLH